MRKWFHGLMASDLAIDLGTSHTRIEGRHKGLLVNEPTVVAVARDHTGTRRLSAVGRAAKEMIGRTPAGIEAIRPMRHGVISDFESVSAMLRHLLRQIHAGRSMAYIRVIVCVPVGVTEVEKRAVREAVLAAGAKEVFLVEESMAAAIGAELPITEPSGNMVVDIGGGRTEVAVISLSGIVFSNSLRTGGEHMDEALIQYAKRKHSLLLGEQTAEEVKCRLGSALADGQLEEMEIRGRDVVHGVPKTILINSDEVREALAESVHAIVDAVRYSLERTPPELAADIVDQGIILAGGGSLLRGLDRLLAQETGLPVRVCEDPSCAAVRGAAAALEQIDLLEKISVG